MANNIVRIWFYVNPDNDAIEGVYSFFPLGMCLRNEGEWEFIRRSESGIDTDLANDDIYELDWDTDPKIIDDSFLDEDFDGDHIAVKLYDNGELDVSELEKYARKIIDGKDIYTPGTSQE